MYIYKIIDIKYVFFSLKSHCRFWQNKNIYSYGVRVSDLGQTQICAINQSKICKTHSTTYD